MATMIFFSFLMLCFGVIYPLGALLVWAIRDRKTKPFKQFLKDIGW